MDYSSSFSNPSSCESISTANKNHKKKKHNNNNNNKLKGGSTTTTKLSTDPQSVAARQRRHRISERFKILQSLVPGGSKMDTVSMLEEAIQYVMFLKSQISLHQAIINFHQVHVHPTLCFDQTNYNNSYSGMVQSIDRYPIMSSTDNSAALPNDYFHHDDHDPTADIYSSTNYSGNQEYYY